MMNISESTYKLLYIIYFMLILCIRAPFYLRYTKKMKGFTKVSAREALGFGIAYGGAFTVPLIHAATPWLNGFPMGLPDWVRLLGPVIAVGGLFLLWRTHRTLGVYWSSFAEITDDHKLIVDGPYKYTRHPMYTAFYILLFAALLDLSNWAVGIISILSWHIFCMLRIRTEEKMMLKEFGTQYEEYMKRTGSLLPKL